MTSGELKCEDISVELRGCLLPTPYLAYLSTQLPASMRRAALNHVQGKASLIPPSVACLHRWDKLLHNYYLVVNQHSLLLS